MIKLLMLLVVAGLCCVGCDRNVKPPAPLAIEELPAALEKAFAKAKPQIKDQSSAILTALQAKDYSKAYLALQNLGAVTGLSREQSSVVSRGTLTVGSLLQSAQSQGDVKAAQTLKTYKATK